MGKIGIKELLMEQFAKPKKSSFLTLNLHIRDFAYVIEEAIRRLPNGAERLALSEDPLNQICLKLFETLAPSETLLSDYGVSINSSKETEKDYFEEIVTIEKIMEESAVPIALSDWQSRIQSEDAEKMHKELNRRAYAIQLWDWYAIPWRFSNNSIKLIWSSRDIIGRPIIREFPVNSFLAIITEIFRKENVEKERLIKKIAFLGKFGAILLIIIGIIIWSSLTGRG